MLGQPYHVGGMEEESRRVEIATIDNGWIVTVHNPIKVAGETENMYKALATILPTINMGAGAGAVRGVDEELDSYKKDDPERAEKAQAQIKQIQETVNAAFEEPPTLRKPVEVYAFLDKKKMMAFLDEHLSVQEVPAPVGT